MLRSSSRLPARSVARAFHTESDLASHIFTSPWGSVDVPDKSITSHVFEDHTQHGDITALIDATTGQKMTYSELHDRILRVAASLHGSMGIKHGDVVCIHAPNIPDYAVWFHAAAHVGAISTCSSPLFSADELADQLTEAGASSIITVAPFAAVAVAAAEKCGIPLSRIVVAGGGADGADGVPQGAVPYAQLLGADPTAAPVSTARSEDVVTLPFSSGTTGKPKGVELTHRNLVANVNQVVGVDPLRPGMSLLGVLPFYHIYAKLCILNYGLHQRATVVTNPRFDPDLFLKTLQDHKVERAHVAPPLIVFLAKHPAVDKYDLSHLKLLFSGAAPVGGATEEAVARRLGVKVKQAYGMTEMSPASHITPDDSIVPGSIGPLVPGCEAVIMGLDDEGSPTGPLPHGEEGELWVRGPNIMRGYLRRPEATAETLLQTGFLRTGDVAVARPHTLPDGRDTTYFAITDRAKELIKYKGHQVSPAELEGLLLEHSDVTDAAVVSGTDEDGQEIPKAYVVMRDGAGLTPDAVMDFVAERVAPFKKVRAVEFIDAIPKSAAGKILRRVLTARDKASA